MLNVLMKIVQLVVMQTKDPVLLEKLISIGTQLLASPVELENIQRLAQRNVQNVKIKIAILVVVVVLAYA